MPRRLWYALGCSGIIHFKCAWLCWPDRPARAPRAPQIVTDGLKQDCIFRVISGRVRVEKGDLKTAVGQGAVVNRLAAGQLFGEMSFLDATLPCATCVADSDDVELACLPKDKLTEMLDDNLDLAKDFYKHMAISVTQRLSIVSAASAEIPEAPRGAAQPLDPGSKNIELSAAKLLKVRRRFNVPDSVAMASMMKTTLVSGRSRKSGTLYVFETMVGFVSKAFGIKTHEAFPFANISEVLRETFTLKLEDDGVELALVNGKQVTHTHTLSLLPPLPCMVLHELPWASTAFHGLPRASLDRARPAFHRTGDLLSAPRQRRLRGYSQMPRAVAARLRKGRRGVGRRLRHRPRAAGPTRLRAHVASARF